MIWYNRFDNREKLKKEILSNRKYQREIEDLEKLADKYFTINKIRNRIAHASFYHDGNYSFRTDIDQAMNHYEDIKKSIK